MWCEEDLYAMSDSLVNQGETTDLTDEFFRAMDGRDLTVFLAQMFREWIYDHVGDLFDEAFGMPQFFDLTSGWSCTLLPDGSVQSAPFDEKLGTLMERFDTARSDVEEYLHTSARKPDYLSEGIR